MKKLLGSLLLGMAALAMPLAMVSLSGCGTDVGESEQIEGGEVTQPEGHEEGMTELMEENAAPPQEEDM